MTEGEEKRKEESSASSSLLFTGPSLIKTKITLVVEAELVESLLCAGHGSKHFTSLPNPNLKLDTAVSPAVQIKKLAQKIFR